MVIGLNFRVGVYPTLFKIKKMIRLKKEFKDTEVTAYLSNGEKVYLNNADQATLKKVFAIKGNDYFLEDTKEVKEIEDTKEVKKGRPKKEDK